MTSPLQALRDAFDLAPHAFVGGCLVAAACAAVGVLLRWRRLVWAGLAVPEAASAGSAFSLGQSTLLPALGLRSLGEDVTETLCTLVATGLAVLWLVPVGRSPRRGGERAAAGCFLLATTAQVLLLSQSPHGTEELRAVATGKTLLFLAREDLTTLWWTMPAIALAAFLLARPTAHAAFDRDHARAQGRSVVVTEATLAVVLFALAAVAVPRAGAPFVFAYVVLPAAAAERCAARPLSTAAVAVALALVGFVVAATAAVAWDLTFSPAAAGGALLAAAVVLAARGLVTAAIGLVAAPARWLHSRGQVRTLHEGGR